MKMRRDKTNLRTLKEFTINKKRIHILGILSVILLYFLNNELTLGFILTSIYFIIVPMYSIYINKEYKDSSWLFSYVMSWVSLNAVYWYHPNHIIYYVFIAVAFIIMLIIYKVHYSYMLAFIFCIVISYLLIDMDPDLTTLACAVIFFGQDLI